MHDRRIDGKAHTFGNYGALYRSAMTWYDHETDSLWSQPIGTALKGAYEGVRLEMIPVSVEPWDAWKQEHPETLVLDTGEGRLGPSDPFSGSRGRYVVGVVLGEQAKAYPFEMVSQQVVVNDTLGDVPVLVYANPEDRSVHIFVRSVQGEELEFVWEDGTLRDRQTGTHWTPANGLALEGALRGELLKELPYSTAYDWAWRSFYPATEFYSGDET